MLIPFEAQNVDYVLEFGAQYVRFYKRHEMIMLDDVAYEVKTPYTSADLETLRYIQKGDYLYLFHSKYPIKTLGMYGETDWRLEDFKLKCGPWEHVNTTENTLVISATTGSIDITADTDLFTENDVGRLVRITCKDSQKVAWQAEKSGISSGQVLYSDGKYYQAMSSGTTGTVKPVHTEGTISDGSILFKYLHAGYGVAEITGYVSATSVTALVIDRFPDELTTIPSDYWELGLIHKGGKYPMCGTFFRNRFCLLIDDNGIPTVCMSNSDDYDNFADKEHGEVLANNAITVPLISDKRNEPCWLASASVLFVGTSTGEFYIDAASAGEALAPDNVKNQQISAVGSLPINPIRVGSHTIFVTASGTSVRDIIYSYSTDTYDPIELSLYGKHLLTSGITGIDYQEYPDKVIWFTVNDGRLIGMTFMTEQNVQAIHQHYLGGVVENFATTHNYENNLDELWVEVTRNIGGDNISTIECLDNGYVVQYPNEINLITDVDLKEKEEALYMKNNSFYFDGGITIYRDVDTELDKDDDISIGGLEHLEGKEVIIQTNGAEQPRQTVTNGEISVKNRYTNISVGLPVDSVYIPQRMYVQGGSGSGVGDVQRIDHITFMFWRTGGGYIGQNFNTLQPIYFRKTDEAMNDSAPLYTGNKTISVDYNTSTIKEKGAQIVVRNDSVFPMNILAIAPHFSTSGNGL